MFREKPITKGKSMMSEQEKTRATINGVDLADYHKNARETWKSFEAFIEHWTRIGDDGSTDFCPEEYADNDINNAADRAGMEGQDFYDAVCAHFFSQNK